MIYKNIIIFLKNIDLYIFYHIVKMGFTILFFFFFFICRVPFEVRTISRITGHPVNVIRRTRPNRQRIVVVACVSYCNNIIIIATKLYRENNIARGACNYCVMVARFHDENSLEII